MGDVSLAATSAVLASRAAAVAGASRKARDAGVGCGALSRQDASSTLGRPGISYPYVHDAARVRDEGSAPVPPAARITINLTLRRLAV